MRNAIIKCIKNSPYLEKILYQRGKLFTPLNLQYEEEIEEDIEKMDYEELDKEGNYESHSF